MKQQDGDDARRRTRTAPMAAFRPGPGPALTPGDEDRRCPPPPPARRRAVRAGLQSCVLAAMLVWAVLVQVAAPAAAAEPAAGESRVALVIGNAAYAQEPLRNPVNDARAMATALRRLGFTVLLHENAGKAAMERAVLDYGRRIAAGGVGIFFYAGHGMQVRGRNYLVPVDAQIDEEAKTRVAAVDLDLLLEQVAEARNRVNVVILDACRNNPFEARLRGRSQGLAAVDAARGTLIAYATAPGSVASDGGGRNGLYTEALLKALEQPGLKVEEVFKRVRVEVSQRSNGTQTPWESSSLTGDLVINVTVNVQASTGASATAGAAPTAVDRDALFWASIKDSRQAADFEAYLRRFPGGTFADLARQRLASLSAPGGAARFDGTWVASLTCPDVPGGARGYQRQFPVEVREGRMRGQFGEPGRNGATTLSGQIEADGTARIRVQGTTSDPRFSGGMRPGTAYGYDVVDARFDERSGSGRRVETRPCSLVFERQGGR